MTTKLLPCPFCWSSASLETGVTADIGGEEIQYVTCVECSAQADPHDWQRRPEAPAPQEHVGAEDLLRRVLQLLQTRGDLQRFYEKITGLEAWDTSPSPQPRTAITPAPDLASENERLRAALTPSGNTKAAYIGEFSFKVDDRDEDGEECSREVVVPWTTIKEIMSAIREHAALERRT